MTAPTVADLDALLAAEPGCEWGRIPGEAGCDSPGRWRGRFPCGCGGTVVACDMHQAGSAHGARLMAEDGKPIGVCGTCSKPVPGLIWSPL